MNQRGVLLLTAVGVLIGAAEVCSALGVCFVLLLHAGCDGGGMGDLSRATAPIHWESCAFDARKGDRDAKCARVEDAWDG